MKHEFSSFHPYLTYTLGSKGFIAPGDNPNDASTQVAVSKDEDSLWLLGKSAFDALGKVDSRKKFDFMYEENLSILRDFRFYIADRLVNRPSSLVFIGRNGEVHRPDLDDFSDADLANAIFEMSRSMSDKSGLIARICLFGCLQEIDHALNHLRRGLSGSLAATIAAAFAFANFETRTSEANDLQKIRSEVAAQAARVRHKRDPKQGAKAFVRECWEAWQENPTRYKTQSAFTIDVLTKVSTDNDNIPIIAFDTVLKKWIPNWTKEKK